jgi:hypothetical protein
VSTSAATAVEVLASRAPPASRGGPDNPPRLPLLLPLRRSAKQPEPEIGRESVATPGMTRIVYSAATHSISSPGRIPY